MIRYRITNKDDIEDITVKEFDYDDNVPGFFSINIKDKSYGYYHDKELKPGEYGFAIVNYWIFSLLETVHSFKNNSSIAISDIESMDNWVQLTSHQESVTLNIVKHDKSGLPHLFKGSLPHEQDSSLLGVVDWNQFKEDIMMVTQQYIDDILNINPRLAESNSIKKLSHLLSLI
ncbi:hypothetical protein NBRC13296_06725 [Paenibacillus chitinolyticus]|uniref:hypothetical protein n=1 Tax=Paenibacillus chitinolyticus TaxID=79263 RepID=UPI0035569911